MNIKKRYLNLSIQSKSSLWFIMCSIAQKGISVITVPLFTRLLSTEQYGTYSLYTSWYSILSIFTSFYLYYGVFNNAMSKFENDRDRYVSSMQGLTISITGIVFILFISTQNIFANILGLAPYIIFFMLLQCLFEPPILFWGGRQRFEYRYRVLVIITLIQSVANPVIGLIAVSLTEFKDTARIICTVLITILFGGFIMIKQFIRGKCFFDKKYWRYGLSLAIPLIPHYLSGLILTQGDRIMIDKMVGKTEVALYSVAYNIGLLVQIFTNSINNAILPWFYEKTKENDFDEMKKTINMLVLLVAVLICSTMLFSPEFVMIFGSSEYGSAVYVIPPVAASMFFVFLYNILAFPQFYFEKTQFLMISSIVAAGINIVLNFFFIQLFGYVAAGYTTLICYILYSVGHYFVSMKICKAFLPNIEIYNVKFISIVSIVVVCFGTFCNILFDFLLVRFLLAIFILFFCFVKRNELYSMLKKIKK